MSSYNIKKGIKRYFRFFENRFWLDDQEHYTNAYFIFEVNENDLKSLGYIYWAHLDIWKNRYPNSTVKEQFKVELFEDVICKELDALNLNNDDPNFGYNEPELNVLTTFWNHPRFKIIKKTPSGLICSDEEQEEYYFDLSKSDICSAEDLEYEDELTAEGSYFTCNPGDPVFMSDNDFNLVKEDFLEKIKVLNSIYSKANFPYQIKINRG